MENPQEILAFQIEIYHPIEIINPRVTRYMVGKQFSKLVWDSEFKGWVAVSRGSNKRALIGSANIKGVIFASPGDPAPTAKPKRGRPAFDTPAPTAA